MIKRSLYVLTVLAVLTTNALAGSSDDVKKVVDEVRKIVNDKEMKKNEAKRRQALRKTISTIFDYGEMAKRSMGKHWNPRSAAEKKQFIDLFTTLLENSYVGKVESYSNEKMVFLKETEDGEYSEVKSKIITDKRDEYSFDYRMLKQNGKWMVYDIVVEGVSLVSNYRTQFNKIISADGYPALLKKLQTKSDELKVQ
jgi:phospholipid transport system substrate-binding protein